MPSRQGQSQDQGQSQQERSLWVDVRVGPRVWEGSEETIRPLRCLLQCWLAEGRRAVRPCRFDPVRRHYVTVEAEQLRLGTKSSLQAVEPAGGGLGSWSGLRTQRWPDDAREVCWHLMQAIRRGARLGQAVYERVLWRVRRGLVRVRRGAAEVPFQAGDVLLVPGHIWRQGPSARTYTRLRQERGVRVVPWIHDINPLRYPHFYEPELTRRAERCLPGLLTGADLIVTVSEFSRGDLLEWARHVALEMPEIQVVRPGVEAAGEVSEQPVMGLLSRAPGPFVLCVGPVAASKNSQLLLQVWRRLIDRHGGGVPTLVLAGELGWRAEQVLRDLRGDRGLARHVVVLGGASEGQLRYLYGRCLFSLYPAMQEGWAYPLAESLARGKYAICSSAGSMPEVGGDLVDYHDPLDGATCLELIEKALLEPGWLASREDRIRRGYRRTDWGETARQVFHLLDRRYLLLPEMPLRRAA